MHDTVAMHERAGVLAGMQHGRRVQGTVPAAAVELWRPPERDVLRCWKSRARHYGVEETDGEAVDPRAEAREGVESLQAETEEEATRVRKAGSKAIRSPESEEDVEGGQVNTMPCQRMRALTFGGLVLAVALLLWGSVSVSSAHAAMASWWHLESSAAPTNLPPGGKGIIVVTLTNIGDETVNGATNSVTITDKLPTGLQASATA